MIQDYHAITQTHNDFFDFLHSHISHVFVKGDKKMVPKQ